MEILREMLAVATRTSEMRLDNEAKKIFERAYPVLTQDRSGLFGSATSRAEAQVLRISMVLALVDGSPVIRHEDMIRALDVWRYAEESAFFIFGDREPDQRANKIIDFLRSGSRSQTEIINGLFKKNGEGIASVLEHLQAVGKIRSNKEKTGGRNITFWELCWQNTDTE
jgi:DNA replicative helicase MCM subunit Mcm2 (Cdc46/Mcm family)